MRRGLDTSGKRLGSRSARNYASAEGMWCDRRRAGKGT
jgi:hypothetical protein